MNINMKANYIRPRRLLVATACALFTLSLVATSLTSAGESGRFVVVPVENPRYRGNEIFRAFENYYSPRICELPTLYGLDAVMAGETDEWERILLLRHWIRLNIAHILRHAPRSLLKSRPLKMGYLAFEKANYEKA